MIAVYQTHVFKCKERNKLGMYNSYNNYITYLFSMQPDSLTKTLDKLKDEYPNESIRVYKDIKRPLPNINAKAIEYFMKTDKDFLIVNRSEKIKEILK